jgi:hypothetical protein
MRACDDADALQHHLLDCALKIIARRRKSPVAGAFLPASARTRLRLVCSQPNIPASSFWKGARRQVLADHASGRRRH